MVIFANLFECPISCPKMIFIFHASKTIWLLHSVTVRVFKTIGCLGFFSDSIYSFCILSCWLVTLVMRDLVWFSY